MTLEIHLNLNNQKKEDIVMLKKALIALVAVLVSVAIVNAQTIINGAAATFITMYSNWCNKYARCTPKSS